MSAVRLSVEGIVPASVLTSWNRLSNSLVHIIVLRWYKYWRL